MIQESTFASDFKELVKFLRIKLVLLEIEFLINKANPMAGSDHYIYTYPPSVRPFPTFKIKRKKTNLNCRLDCWLAEWIIENFCLAFLENKLKFYFSYSIAYNNFINNYVIESNHFALMKRYNNKLYQFCLKTGKYSEVFTVQGKKRVVMVVF